MRVRCAVDIIALDCREERLKKKGVVGSKNESTRNETFLRLRSSKQTNTPFFKKELRSEYRQLEIQTT